jgi:hypothetical protein
VPAQGQSAGADPTRRRRSFLPLFLFLVCLTAVWVIWPGNATPVLAFLRAPRLTPTLPVVYAEMGGEGGDLRF